MIVSFSTYTKTYTIPITSYLYQIEIEKLFQQAHTLTVIIDVISLGKSARFVSPR